MKKIPIDQDSAERAAGALDFRIYSAETDLASGNFATGRLARKLVEEGIANDKAALEHINASIKAEQYNGPG